VDGRQAMHTNAADTRLSEFEHARTNAKSTLMRNSYAQVINLTKESLWVFKELVEAYEAGGEEHILLDNQRLDQRNQNLLQIRKQLQEATQQLDSKSDDLTRAAVTLRIRMLQSMLETDLSGVNAELLHIQTSIRLEVVPRLAEQLFDKIYFPDEKSFKLEAVKDGINFAIGLVPWLSVFHSGLLTVYGIATRRKRLKRDTDQHLLYLEDYSHALNVWCDAAHSAIRSLQPIDE
jgi:hypothetical protein